MGFMKSSSPLYQYSEGNLLDALRDGVVDYAAQGCNCFNRMGRGLAAEVRDRVPNAVKVDSLTTTGCRKKLGGYTHVEWPAGTGRVFVNGYTQYHWTEARNNEPKNAAGKPVLCDYKAIRQLFRGLHREFNPNWTLGLPLLGCGLANGDWEKVHQLIESELIFKGRAVVVIVFDRQHLPVSFRSRLG